MEKIISLKESSGMVVPTAEKIATMTIELLQENQEEFLKNTSIHRL